MIRVTRRRRGKPLDAGAVYIGRPSRWGNPFEIGIDGTRAEVIEKYRAWIAERPMLVLELIARYPESLVCWCAPEPCHGDVLAELIYTTIDAMVATSPLQREIERELLQGTGTIQPRGFLTGGAL